MSANRKRVYLPTDMTKVPNCAEFTSPDGVVFRVKRKYREALELVSGSRILWVIDPEPLFTQGWDYDSGVNFL